MKIKDIVEGRLGNVPLLYHATGCEEALEILHSGNIEPRTEAIINGRTIMGVSLTRSRWFASHFNTVVFGFDANSLRRGVRTHPYADPGLDDSAVDAGEPSVGDYRREAEEFVPGSVPLKYLVGIWISENSSSDDPNHPNNRLPLTQIMKHPLYQGWMGPYPYRFDPDFAFGPVSGERIPHLPDNYRKNQYSNQWFIK